MHQEAAHSKEVFLQNVLTAAAAAAAICSLRCYFRAGAKRSQGESGGGGGVGGIRVGQNCCDKKSQRGHFQGATQEEKTNSCDKQQNDERGGARTHADRGNISEENCSP